MSRAVPFVRRSGFAATAMLATMALSACSEQATAPNSPLLPPEPPSNPQVLSAAWTMDVNRTTGDVRITPPSRGNSLDAADLAILGDYFGVAPDAPDLSILAGDVVEIIADNSSFFTSAVGEFVPGLLRTTFDVQVRNKLTAVNLITPTFPAPPAGTDGIVLFPFEIVVTETPGGVTGGQGDGTDVIVESPNGGVVAPSVDWDVAPFNFFNDAACAADSNDCYRSEIFTQPLQGGATGELREVGFDLEPTVSQFRVRMIVAGDLEDATANTPPTADAGGPYTGGRGQAVTLAGSGSDPDLGGSIVSYNWDFDADGQFDDATGAAAEYVCAAQGTFPIALQVVDNRGAPGEASSSVTCTDTAPVAEAGGPYTGFVGTPLALAGSATDDGTIVSYEWDFDADGLYDDATGAAAEFTCVAEGSVTLGLQVTDDATQTSTDVATVTCGTQPVGTIRGRWIDSTGATVTSIASGDAVTLQIDVLMEDGNSMDAFQGVVFYDEGTALTSTSTADLVCGAAFDCPSGTGTATDVMNNFFGNPIVGTGVAFANFSVAGPGFSIQGLGQFNYTAGAAGVITPTLQIDVAAAEEGAVDLAPNLQVVLPTLTIN